MLQPPLQLPFGNSAKDPNSYSSCMGLPIIEVLCSSIDLSFCHKQRVDYYKTTYRLGENISSFWEKQRIVLVKTTCRFEENNVSFWWKQRVVLRKTTYRFGENNVSFYEKWRVVFKQHSDAEKTIDEPPIKNRVFRTVKKSTITPSRAHAYAHITGLFAFLLSQVSQHPS